MSEHTVVQIFPWKEFLPLWKVSTFVIVIVNCHFNKCKQSQKKIEKFIKVLKMKMERTSKHLRGQPSNLSDSQNKVRTWI